MKKIFFLLVISIHFLTLSASGQIKNEELGFEMTLPENWKQVPVVEANKNMSAVEAVRNESNREYMAFVVFPSSSPAVDKTNLNEWCGNMAKAFGTDPKSIRNTEFFIANGYEWYSMIMNLGDGKLISYYTIIHGFSYSLSFVSDNRKDKQFDMEASSIASSIVFNRPTMIDTVKKRFENATAEKLTGIVVPKGYDFTDSPDPKKCAPYAMLLYQSLLKDKNTQLVLVADSAKYQLFCLNVILKQTPTNNETNTFVSKYVGNMFKKDGANYDEVFVGPFEKSPENVFLHKFRLTRSDAVTSHYIFYCTKGEETNIIKIQCPQYFEKEFEESFYDLILKNI